MKTKSQQLTKSETQVMNYLWCLSDAKGSAADIMACYDEPKPAMTTLLTFLKILEEKGFVSSEKVGRGKVFTALVSRRDYTSAFMREVRSRRSFRSLPRRNIFCPRKWTSCSVSFNSIKSEITKASDDAY